MPCLAVSCRLPVNRSPSWMPCTPASNRSIDRISRTSVSPTMRCRHRGFAVRPGWTASFWFVHDRGYSMHRCLAEPSTDAYQSLKSVDMNGDQGAPVATCAPAPGSPSGPRNRRLPLLMLSVILGVGACTSPTAPVGSVPGSTVTPSATSSATTVPLPTRPPQQPTPDSAVAFVRYFWALYNYAYQTFDTKPLEAISDHRCSFCSAILGDVRRIAKERSAISGYRVTLTDADSPPAKITKGTLVIGVLSQRPGEMRALDASTTKLPGFKSVRSTVSVRWDGYSWHVEGVTNDPKTRKPW